MNDPSERIQHLLDRTAISDCLQRYARGIDRHDVELVASCYHPDAVDDHGHYLGSGRGLAEWANAVHADYPRHQHHLTNHLVEIEGDTAHAETYFLVIMRARSGAVSLGSGRYIDRFERRDGEWKIAARLVTVEQQTEPAAADMALLDRAFVAPAHDRSDPSYQRPLVVARAAAGDPHPLPDDTPD